MTRMKLNGLLTVSSSSGADDDRFIGSAGSDGDYTEKLISPNLFDAIVFYWYCSLSYSQNGSDTIDFVLAGSSQTRCNI